MNPTVLILEPTASGLVFTPSIVRLPHPDAEVHRCELSVSVTHERVSVSDVPTVALRLRPGRWRAHWFTSDWGAEFTPDEAATDQPLHLGVTTGRSSKGMHPWLCLIEADGEAVVVSVAWSGNWRIDVTPVGDGAVEVRAGISSWEFERLIEPGTPFEGPPVYVSRASSRPLAAAGLAEAFSRSAAVRTSRVPVAWNHWWPYEDALINHDTFLANAAVAADLGADLTTLDAGWFGPADAETFWEHMRGDWDDENTVRFPAGTAGLAKDVRELGVDFGIWCELEAVGPKARIATEAPEVLAHDDAGAGLGYVCLGSPAGWTHARSILGRLLERTGARWLKVDFNLDPGAGCRRTDHGHGSGDGLYEHYRGLYRLLDEIRASHPELIVEGCSSGGLRIDLGLLAHLHCTFLSDPDWTEFQLQLLWGASQMLPAASIFHFSESQWRGFHPLQHLNLTTISDADFDASLDAVALHRYAVSLPLVDATPAQRERLRSHFRIHAEVVAPLLREHSVVLPLTEQPLREGGGERWPVFQLRGEQSHVVLALALDGHGDHQVVRPVGLEPERDYRVRLLSVGSDLADLPDLVGAGTVMTGARLSAGLMLRRTGPGRSWLVAIDPLEAASD